MRTNFLNKSRIIYFFRIIFLILIIFLFSSTFLISYEVISITSFNLISIFSLFSIIYFSFIENKEDRGLLVDIWKIYFPSIILMFSIIFSIDNYATNVRIDSQKTILNYYLKQNNIEESKIAFNQYNEAINKHLEIFKKEDLSDVVQKTFFDAKKENKKGDENKKFIFWYANFLINMINILTLFMFLRCFVELSKFKINIEEVINIEK